MLAEHSGVFHTFNGVYAVNALVGFSLQTIFNSKTFSWTFPVFLSSENLRLKLSEERQLEGQICRPPFACIGFSNFCVSTQMVVFATQTFVERIHGKSAS